jgi:hypothetical protein
VVAISFTLASAGVPDHVIQVIVSNMITLTHSVRSFNFPWDMQVLPTGAISQPLTCARTLCLVKAYAAPSARRAGFRSSSLEVGVSETPEPFSTTAIEDS